MQHVDREVPPHRSHKDRKRWCRGKPGIEHVIERQEGITGWPVGAPCRWFSNKRDPEHHWLRCTESDVCTNCGKQFWVDNNDCKLQKEEA